MDSSKKGNQRLLIRAILDLYFFKYQYECMNVWMYGCMWEGIDY